MCDTHVVPFGQDIIAYTRQKTRWTSDAADGREAGMSDDEQGDAEAVLTDKEWQEVARQFLKVELTRSKMTYDQLSKLLREIGVEETEVSIRNKISRGTFPATFLFQCMRVMGVQLIPFKATYQQEIVFPPELLGSPILRSPKKGG